MSSQSRIEANRRNAAHSTGPRTATGKRRASRNARKHGLSVGVRYDPGMSNKIGTLALAIAGKNATPRRLQSAHDVAEAELELRHVQELKLSLIEVEAAAIRDVTKIADGTNRKNDNGEYALRDLAQSEMRASSVLTKLERYERRALSRHWRAINKYVAAMEESEA